MLDYTTVVVPRNIGEQNREFNRRWIEARLGWKGEKHHPYRYLQFLGTLNATYDAAESNAVDLMVIDLTCLTKIHTAALAYSFAAREFPFDVVLAYSTPESYGSQSRDIFSRGRWKSVVVTRLDLDSTHRYRDTHSIGLLGHEGDRLRLALREIEPVKALLLTIGRLHKFTSVGGLAVRNNAALLEAVEAGLRPGYQVERIDVNEVARLRGLVSAAAEQAKLEDARLVICPFGPKPSLVVAFEQALRTYREGVWISYPIHVTYDAEYTAGCEDTLWYHPSTNTQYSFADVETFSAAAPG